MWYYTNAALDDYTVNSDHTPLRIQVITVIFGKSDITGDVTVLRRFHNAFTTVLGDITL